MTTAPRWSRDGSRPPRSPRDGMKTPC